MADLDSLQIKIQAQAQQASNQIDTLVKKLGKLSTSLSGIKAGGLNQLSNGVNSLSSAMGNIKNVDTRTFSTLAKNLDKLSNINTSGLSNASNAIHSVGGSIATLSGIDFRGNGLNSFINAVTQLSSVNLSGLNNVDFGSLGNKINQLSNSLSNAKKVQSNTIQLVNSIGRLAASSGNIGETASTLPRLGAAIKNVASSLSTAKSVSENIIQLTMAIGQLASAGKKAGQTASSLGVLATELKKFMQVMSGAPSVSSNVIQMTQALAQLASSGSRAGSSMRSMEKFNFDGISKGFGKIRSSSFSLASALGKLYATYWMLFRAFGLFRDAIDISSSLTEVENVVRQTFGRYENLIDDFSKTCIDRFGMSELSAKQFASRFQAMGTALDIPQGKMADMSIRLTELTGDMASFYDVSQSDVAKSLQSVFSGTTAPMRRYGIDLTQATLKEWALKQGLDADISSMSQAEKAMLRYQYVLAHTTNITGDFKRTQDSWHNQVTLLTENFRALGAVVGSGLINAFKPFLRALNKVLQKVISFAEMVTDALGSIFGWRYEASKDVGITDDLADSYDDVGDAASNAADGTKKAAKEAKKAVRAFDELKVISSNKDSNSSGKGNGSGGGSGSGSSTGNLVAVDPIYKDFESNIKDLEQLGESISGALISAMQSIDWDSVYAAADGFGTGLAQFLNGLFKDQKGTTLFGEVGKTIAGALNTVLHGLDSFGTTFDWKQFGKSISDGINNFFSTFDWKLAADTFNTLAHGILDVATEAVSGTDWSAIGQDIGTLLAEIDWIGLLSDVGKLIWEALKAAVETWKGMFDKAPFETAILTAIGLLKISGVGKTIVGKVSKAVKLLLKSKGLSLGKIAFGLGMAGTTVFLMDSDDKVASIIGAPITAFLAGYTFTGNAKLSLKIAAPVLAADAGLTIGKAIGDAIADATQPEEMKQYQVDFTWSDLFSYSPEEWGQGFKDWWNDTLGPAFELMSLDMATGNYKFKIPFTDIELPSLNEAKKGFTNWLSGVNKYWGKKKDSVLEIGAKIKNKASELWSGFKKDWKNGKEKAAEFKTKISSKAKDLWEKFKTSWGNSKVASFLLKIGSKAKDLWDKFKTAWGETKTAKFLLKIGSKISELWKNFKDSWGEKKTVSFLTKRATKISELWKDFKDSWGEKKSVTIGIGFVKNSLSNLWSSVTSFFGGKSVSVDTKATKKADGGVFAGGSWHKPKMYAAGGLPSFGQVFVAREAGPELVGNLGGHTAVLNNDQIVSSVANGVAQATEAVLRSHFRGNANSGQPIQIVLDGKVIFDSTRRSAQEFFKRTGTAPYPV